MTSLTLFVNAFYPAVHEDNRLASHGLAPTARDHDVHNVYFTRSLGATLPGPKVPSGYTIRPIKCVGELEDYRALYDFAAINVEHQRELLLSNEYSHLVVADPAGTFVAYCEFSICRAEWQGSGERIGWIDYIGTAPEQRRRGLGRAVLLATLQELKAWGTDRAMLITISTNEPAVQLYSTMGFTRVDVPETGS